MRSMKCSHYCRLSSSSSSKRHRFSTLIAPNAQTTNTESRFKTTFSQFFQQCSDGFALRQGKQAHSRMIVSGFKPTVFVANCLIQMYVKCCNLDYAKNVFDEMPERDTVSWNTVIFGFIGSGKTEIAQSFFDAMPRRDTVSWNSMISGYLQSGEISKLISVSLQMKKSDVVFDATTLALILKACSVVDDFDLGVQIHGVAVKTGFVIDVVTGSSLLDMYGKCKRPKLALQVFNEMPEKNIVSWSAIIAGCVQNDRFVEGLKVFVKMQREGVGVSQSCYASLLKSCAGFSAFKCGTQLHGHSIKTLYSSDVLVGTATLDMYAKCRRMTEARKKFESMPNHGLQSYNAIITGYVRSLRGHEALHLFLSLLKSGLGFNEISLSGALVACALVKAYLLGIQLHGLAVKSQLRSNTCVSNAVLDMYGKCGYLVEASVLFDEIGKRDTVSWNAIIAANEQNGNGHETLRCFVSMLASKMEPDQFTYGSVLKVCAAEDNLNHGTEIHGRIIKCGLGSDPFVGGTLVDMYSKCTMVEEAEKIHVRTEEPTMVSWNTIISGLSLQNRNDEAQRFFSRMLESGVGPDNFTYAAILDTCADLATIGLGMQIHAQVIKQELQSEPYVSNTLVDMYSKCGNMRDSRRIFERSRNRDPVAWNAMICGYAHHGLGEEAIKIFEEMIGENIEPNQATFVTVLRACAHVGNVEKGLQFFGLMQTEYDLAPELDHYSCMVDIIGRSGQVNEAMRLIQTMPIEADAVVWRTMLSICHLHGEVELAETVAENLLRLEPRDSSGYVLMSNVYADSGMWVEMSEMRRAMRSLRLKKEPGCSWIEVRDEVHAFLVADKAHPKRQEIYERLNCLVGEMKWFEENEVNALMVNA